MEIYLKNAYFLFQGRFLEQIEGMARGPIVANLHMKDFAIRAISRAQATPKTVKNVFGWHICITEEKTRRIS